MSAGSPARPRVVGSVAIVTSRFPMVTETFILRELVELERQGVPLVLVPLLRQRVSSLHDEAAAWTERALYSPFLSGAILVANARVLARRPARYLGTLLGLLARTAGNGNALRGTLGIFAKSVWNGSRVRARGVRHVHAHFATHPAMAALVMATVHGGTRAGDLPFSVTAHAHDIFVTHAGLAHKLGAARFVRCISAFNARYLATELGLPQDRMPVIHCGIEPERYASRPAPGRPGVDRPASVLCIAAHQPYKGLTHLVEAVRIARADGLAVECKVVGDGPLREELEAQARTAALGEAMSFLGTRTQAEVAALLTVADVFVLPSVVAPDGQMEGLPVALMEALAAGVPVIATRISGIPELVRDGQTGTLVEPGDARALAAALRRVVTDVDAARAEALRGRQLVREHFEARGQVALLADVLARHGAEVEEPAAVLELARRAATLAGAGEARTIGLEACHDGADGLTAHLLLPGSGPRRVVAKRHGDPPHAKLPAAARAANDHAALVALHREGLSVPEPLGLDAEAAVVVMSRSGGVPLARLVRELRRLGAPPDASLAALHAAGAWLHALARAQGPARATGAFDREAVLSRLLAECREDAARCEAAGLPPQLARRLLARAQHDVPALIAREATCWTHGDYWPGNVLLEKDGTVTVIDLEGLRPGVAEEDAACFLEHVALALPARTSFGLLASRRRRAEAAFVAGLRADAEQRPVAAAWRAAKLLRLAGISASARDVGGAARRWRRFRLAQRMRELVAS